MKFQPKILGVLLLMAVALPAAAWPAWYAATPQRPGGCHQHGPAKPASPPTSYACCEAGHHTALLPETFTLRLSWLQISRAIEPGALASAHGTICNVERELLQFQDPPGLSPLRI